MAKKKAEKAEPAKRAPGGTVRGKKVYDTIKKIGANNEIGGIAPTRLLGKGISAV